MAYRRVAQMGIAIASILASSEARADAFGVFGFGAAGLGEANARAARAEDGTAAYYSPGGLALGHGAHAEVSTQAVWSQLAAAGQHQSFDDPVGVQLALDADVPFRGFLADRFRVAIGIHSLPTSVLRVSVREEGTPQNPYYDNRTQRLVVLPSLGLRLTDSLGIGVSANVLAGLGGNVDVRPGTSRNDEPRIDEVANTVVSPILGARFDPIDSLHLAVTWRQRFGVDVRVATEAEIGGIPLGATVVKHDALFDPAALTFAASWSASSQTSFEIDATYFRWKSWSGPFFQVSASLPGVNAASLDATPSFRDTFTVRGAVATSFDVGEHQLTIRAGGGYEPSILGNEPQGATNLVDSTKIILATGATLALRHALGERTVRLGIGLQGHILPTHSEAKIACTAVPCPLTSAAGPNAMSPSSGITDPGYPKLDGGGFIGAGALSLGVDL